MATVLQVVDGEGDFNTSGVTEYMRDQGVEAAGVNYTVVAIMGPQSSGKSTLLNHLFGTRFEEMDALAGRSQTTRGIWLARSPKVAAPPTLVMDLEGSDGRERGEDDTSFERQSALFALASSDILLVNMWAKDVGRETGSGKPLLKTIFQVNLKLFQPSPGAKRTVLLFVFRDRTKTPLEKLRETWEADLQRMWDAIAKPQAYESSAITDFFDVQYAALSNYEDRQDDFIAESTILRRRFTDDADDGEGFLRQSPHKLPGQALALSMGKVWEVIHENKDLNLPAHRVMVANIRCTEIADEQVAAFTTAHAWKELSDEADQDLIPGFGKKAGALLDAALAAYEEEARYFDARVSSDRHAVLAADLHAIVRPAFDSQMVLAKGVALESFRLGMGASSSATETFVDRAIRCSAAALSEFDMAAQDILVPGTEWTAATGREELQRAVAAHQAELRAEHVALVLSEAATTVEAGVSAGVMPLLEAPPGDLWPRLAAVVDREVKTAAATLATALRGYGIEPTEEAELLSRVRAAARGRLLANAREAANTVLPRMKDRFADVFQKDEQGLSRTWAPSVDIPAVAASARREAARLLSMLSVVRLNQQQQSASAAAAASAPDAVERAVLLLAEPPSSTQKQQAPAAAGGFDIISAAEWPDVNKEDVLLTPAQVRTAWRQFSSDSALAVQQAKGTQEANKLAQNRLPPLWAIAAMIFLGFNEMMAVLRNPFWLVVLLIGVAFGRTVYQELDVEGEMARGLLPGALALSAKFVPTVKAVSLRTFESGKALLEGPVGDGMASGDGERGNQTSTGAMRVRYDDGNGVGAGAGIGEGGVRARKPQGAEVQMSSLRVPAEAAPPNRKDD